MTIEKQLAEIRATLAGTAAMVEQNEKRAAHHREETAETFRRLSIIAEQNEVRAAEMMDTLNRLGRIIQIHEQRIDAVEGRRPA